MDFSLSTEQQALQDATARLYAKESHPLRFREAEKSGFDAVLWRALVDVGLPTMALSEAMGGLGASLTDIAVAVEQHGAHLGSAPLVETVVTNRLLDQLATQSEPARRVLDEIVESGATAVLALRRAETTGQARLVPGAAMAAVVVALDGDVLVAALAPHTQPRPTLAALAVADVDLNGAVPLGSGGAVVDAAQRAWDEWRALTAVAQAGLADAALRLGVEYVIGRHQFGVPIGSFQAVQHALADQRTRVDGALLLAYKAAWALDEGEPDAAELAAMAVWYCGQVAEEAAATSLHYHGGYGFMLESDVQLHVRRAKTTRVLAGPPPHELQLVARRRWRDPRPDRARDRSESRAGMDFRFSSATDEFRAEVRAFIAEHLTQGVIERVRRTGTIHDGGFHRALCERGYLAASWPVQLGGLGRDPIEQTLLTQELREAGAPADGLVLAGMVGAVLALRGNDHQRREIVPRILAGDVMCCLGFSEPNAGSDVAAVETRAVREDDDWVINGQKMFTTIAHEAHYVFLLARTNPAAPKHKGLTTFLVPMDTAGIEVTAVETLGGERTNITFYNDVRVPESARVGDVDGGWSVMATALIYERTNVNWGEFNRLVESAARWALAQRDDGSAAFDDPVVCDCLARAAIDVEVGWLLLYRAAWLAAQGKAPQVEAAMAKLHTSEAFVRAASQFLDNCGPSGLLPEGEPESSLGGLVEHAFRHSMVTTIYGGSSEIQREIIANRGLHLPRSR